MSIRPYVSSTKILNGFLLNLLLVVYSKYFQKKCCFSYAWVKYDVYFAQS
jgi:hypothetical protein